MNTLFSILTIQIVLGALDNLWHHELTERLPQRRAARLEIALHSLREFIYAIIFFGLAWWIWGGVWAYVLIALFALEVGVTLADFVVEDKTRRLPPSERVLHTLLAINGGAFIGVFVPVALQWSTLANGFAVANYGAWSLLLSLAAVAVGIWSLRNATAALRWFRPPTWQQKPYVVGHSDAPRTILVTGATGFVGRNLCRHLLQEGDKVIVLARDSGKAWDLFGDLVRIITTFDALDNTTRIDAIVNLAGEPIAARPWTKSRRKQLLQSRLTITNGSVRLIERLKHKPEVLVNASAVGYYGVHGEKRLIETEAAGDIFQSVLCAKWEAAAMAARDTGTRVCLVRLGLVLGQDGGVLQQLLLPLKFKLNIIFGNGNQWVSWIHVTDATRLIEFAIANKSLQGAINGTSPKPVRHAELMMDLAKRRRSVFRLSVPALLMRTLLGDLAQLFVDGQKVVPLAAPALGFKFHFEKLNRALDDLLKPKSALKPLEVYFDAACPICDAEIELYRRQSDAISANIEFTDISTNTRSLGDIGLSQDVARRRLYARLASGTITSGIDAFVEIWRRLPGYRWLARVVSLPGVHALCETTYDVIAAPIVSTWSARRRMRPAHRG